MAQEQGVHISDVAESGEFHESESTEKNYNYNTIAATLFYFVFPRYTLCAINCLLRNDTKYCKA